jgi:hypothetical protein
VSSHLTRGIANLLHAIQISADVSIDDLVLVVEEGEVRVLVEENLRRCLRVVHSAQEAPKRNAIYMRWNTKVRY